MKLAHYTIRTRLRLGFGLILLLLFSIAATGLFEMSKSNAATTRIVQVNLRKIALLEQMSDSVHIVSRVVRSIALLSDPARIAVEREKVAQARAKYDRAFTALQEMPLDAAGQAYVEEFKQLQTDVRPLNNRFLELAAQHDPSAVTYLLDVANPATKKWQDAIRAFMDLQEEKSSKDAAEAEQAYASARVLMLGLAFVSLAGGMLFAVWITRSIVRPLTSAVDLARQVSAGDLGGAVAVHPGDRTETGALLRALNDMNQQLNGIVGRVREGAHTLTMSSAEIAQGNLDLSSRTEQQAGALQQTAASMEELAATVKNNADNVKSASALASDTAQVAAHGGAVVGQVVDVMHGIESSSGRIVDIIDVIDGIAFQTNILALNAAVEAARAGEQGRGFAVVASEVRTLAQRSATAAREIKGLIHASVDQIKTGGTLVRDAGTTMERIVGGIGKVSSLVSEIATATEQQSIGIEETHLAVSALDRINQENTALVEEIAASAVSLKDEALTLDTTVSRFTLTNDARPQPQPAPSGSGRAGLSPAVRRLAA